MSVYQDHVTWGLETLVDGLIPFVESELRAVYQGAWLAQARSSIRDDRGLLIQADDSVHWDAHSLLTVMWDQWNAVFRRKLSLMERSLVGELREYRNRWAHRGDFDFDDTYRTLDSISRLLRAIGAPQHQIIAQQKLDLLQEQFGEMVNAELKKKEAQRNKWQVVIVNSVCALLVVSQLIYQYGWQVWSFALLAIVGFAFVTYRQLAGDRPAVGVRECPRCRKIIYSVRCPYCEPASVPGIVPLEPNKAGESPLPPAAAAG